MAKSQKNERPAPDHVTVIVTVCDHIGQPVDTAMNVALVDGKKTHKLKREGSTAVYTGAVPQGTYTVNADGKAGVAPPQTHSVAADPTSVTLFVGARDWPFYRLGQSAVPFPPPGPMLAVAFPDVHPDQGEAKKLCDQITKELPLAPAVPEYSKDKDAFMQADGAIWLFRITQKDTPKLRADLHKKILRITGNRGRVGVPVDLNADQIKVIDNQFVLRFVDGTTEGEIDAYIARLKGTSLRSFRQARNARLVALPPGDLMDHLRAVEDLHDAGLLIYGEPDIMAELSDDAFPEDPPNDPTFAAQANLTLQNVDVAWRMLDVAAPQKTLGDPDVVVASLDRGLDTDHPDIGGNLSDGSAQVLRCYDFSGLRECTVPGYQPDTSHGMGVYGIIAALTNNGDDVSGIAPNTRQIVMERPSLSSANYPDVLLWAAGFTTGNPSAGWPAEPLADGADIISCSHGDSGVALSGIMDDTFQLLANSGRGGLGTIVVYSAGNANTLITGFRTWAAHPDTLAIANSNLPDGGGVERKVGSSNFGPEIDICAQGAGAPSLNASGGEQTFGGTSAAAPTVAAACALILSGNPGLRLEEVRAILRDTAVKIDVNNANATGRWRDVNNLISTNPAYAGPNFSQFYGFGRLNVSAAVERAGWRLSLFLADNGDYGHTCLGSFKDMMLTLSNSGVNTVPITNIVSSNAEFVVPNVLDYPLFIEPGNALQVPIRFDPASLGNKSATISVESGPFQTRTIKVTGKAPAPELDLIIAAGGDFGKTCVDDHVDQTLSLVNSGPCPLTVANITSSSADFVVADLQSFPIRIAPGTAVEVPIRFAPNSIGAKSAVITVTSDDPTGPKSVRVSGKVLWGKIAVTGSTCIGGVQAGCLGETTITICNTGDCKLNVASVAFKRPSKYWKLVGNPFPAVLHPGSCLNVLIRYRADQKCPTPNKLIIKSDDPKTPVKKLRLLAYTSSAGSKSACGCDTGCNDACCSVQSIDPCCWDECSG